jgi:hypothetical protein
LITETSSAPSNHYLEAFLYGSATFTGAAASPSSVSIPSTWPAGGYLGPSVTVPLSTKFNQDGTATISVTGTQQTWKTILGGWLETRYPVSASRTVTVRNVAPTITQALQNGVNGNIVVNEGASVSLRMSSTDPGADAQEFSINGASAGTGGSSPGSTRNSSTLNRLFDDEGSFTNSFRVDDDDTSRTLSRTVIVENVAPQVTAFELNGTNGPLTVDEGAPVVARLFATDPGADELRFLIDGLDAAAGGSIPGSTRSSQAISLGAFDDGVYVLNGQVTDGDGGQDATTVELTVRNLAPVISQFSLPATVDRGGLFSFSAAGADPGGDPLHFDWDLNNDGSYDDFSGASGQWAFSTSGLLPVGLRISDSDGGFAFASQHIAVAVPEPASLALWAGAASGLLLLRRRSATVGRVAAL